MKTEIDAESSRHHNAASKLILLHLSSIEDVRVGSNDYNDPNRRLDTAERLNVFLVSCGSLWNDELFRLKTKLKNALLIDECKSFSQSENPTLSTSASENIIERRKAGSSSIDKNYNRLMKKYLIRRYPSSKAVNLTGFRLFYKSFSPLCIGNL